MKLKRITRPGDSRGPTATQFTAVPYLRTVSNKQAGRLLPMRNVCPTTCAPPLRTFPRVRNSSAHSPLLRKPNRLRIVTPENLSALSFVSARRTLCASHSEVSSLRTPNLLSFALRSLFASHAEPSSASHSDPSSASHSEVFALRTPN